MIRVKGFFRQHTYSLPTNDFTGRFLRLQIKKSCVISFVTAPDDHVPLYLFHFPLKIRSMSFKIFRQTHAILKKI